MTEDIRKLNSYQHVRLKTGMYYGSKDPHTQEVIIYRDGKPVLEEVTWVPAVFTCFREILDNALDEVVAHGHGDRIDIEFNEKKLEFSVKDNGRGIPIDWDEDHNAHKATMAISETMAGRNFGDRGETAGTNGIGAAGVNFSSEYFNLEIFRDNKRFYQEFAEHIDGFEEILQIRKPDIKPSKSPTGTKVSCKLSEKVFTNRQLPEIYLFSRVYEIAVANPTVKFTYNGELIKVKIAVDRNLFPDTRPISFNITGADNFRSRFWIVPSFQERGEHFHTLVNNIFALNGGVHIENFRKLFYSGILKALEKESKKRKLSPNSADVTDGLLIYNITNMKAPDFDSQGKTRLINSIAADNIKEYFKNEDSFADIIKKNKEWIDQIYARCAERTMKKDDSEEKKAAKQAKKKKDPTLLDAAGRDRSKCVILLAEGLSAAAGVANVRNPDIHGSLPLRGKVLNVNGMSKIDILSNEVLVKIMNAIGLELGTKADRQKLRYGQVWLATDEDFDGFQITALLINFFYTFWPELFTEDNPFFFSFRTPFIIAKKGKETKYWYSFNVNEFDPKDYPGWTITRAKGLATLKDSDWAYSLEKPVLFPYTNDEKMTEALDLIFNNKRADDRKNWIDL